MLAQPYESQLGQSFNTRARESNHICLPRSKGERFTKGQRRHGTAVWKVNSSSREAVLFKEMSEGKHRGIKVGHAQWGQVGP